LIVCPGEHRQPVEALAERAVREMEFSIGERQFKLLRMPNGADLATLAEFAGQLCMADGIDAFIGATLPSDKRANFLKQLFGIAGMFGLQTDPAFMAMASALRTEPGLRHAKIGIDPVDGVATVISTLPARLRIEAGDLLIALSDGLEIGTVEHVSYFLAREEERQKLAAMRIPEFKAKASYLLIGDSCLTSIDATLTMHADLLVFHATYVNESPDKISLLALADDGAGAVLDRLARSNNGNAVHEAFHQVYFELVASVPLENGLFLSGWYRDPDHLIEAVIAVDPGLEETDVLGAWQTFDGRADLGDGELQVRRFAAFLPRRGGTRVPSCAPFVRITLSTGESHIASAAPGAQDRLGKRRQILDTIAGHAFDLAMLSEVYAPALRPLQAIINGRQKVREVRQYGLPSVRSVSLVIPLYKETGFIRSQLMAFSVDRFLRENCEIVYVVDDPLIALEVAGILEGSALIYPLDLKLVLLAVNGGYALANNFGVSEANGETLVLMNSDVIPKSSGWLEPVLSRLAVLPAFSAIGPKLLYADGTLQHAGMYFHLLGNGYWQNMHFWKGYAADFAPANVERVVPAITGACMIIRRQDYVEAGGFTPDFVIGDYEDSDLCLKLRQRGGTILYMPSIALRHFERQSMPEDIDQRNSPSTTYNQALHAAKWNDEIELLMSGFSSVAGPLPV
jgi:hypothetical protein